MWDETYVSNFFHDCQSLMLACREIDHNVIIAKTYQNH